MQTATSDDTSTTTLHRPRVVHISPADQELIRQARLDLIQIHRDEQSATAILHHFIATCFGPYMAERLRPRKREQEK